jgi:hypothetical protein
MASSYLCCVLTRSFVDFLHRLLLRNTRVLCVPTARARSIARSVSLLHACTYTGGHSFSARGLGCFLLTHDTPTTARTGYNTSDDLLALISSPALAPYFSQAENGPVFIALCGKYTLTKALCDGSSASNAVIALVPFSSLTLSATNLVFLFVSSMSFSPKQTLRCNRWV